MVYLALGSGLPSFPLDFSCPAVLRYLLSSFALTYGTLTLFGRLSHAVLLQLVCLNEDPTTPVSQPV